MSDELTPERITSAWWPEDVRLSPDGQLAAWSASPYGKDGEHNVSGIWVAEVDGDASGRRWTHGGADTRPRWSPDGSRLAFLSDRKERGTTGLFVLSVRGGEAEPIVVRKRSISAFAWSPDGESLAFVAPDEPDDEDKRREQERDDADVYGHRRQFNRLHLVNLETREVSTLLSQDLHVTDLAWSPGAGTMLAMSAQATPETNDLLRVCVGGEYPERRSLQGVRGAGCGGSRMDHRWSTSCLCRDP
jgi:dipeptidyl aminopeptidase/acylaminoacyl peptidase